MSFGADEEILQDFLVEAGEILELLSEQLVELESRPDDADLLNAIFRGFHTVKGGAGFLQLHELVECCHIAENVFDILRKGERAVDSELMDVVLEALDAVNGMFSQVRERAPITAATPELLAALARWVQVLMCVHNPCEHYWSDIVADKDLLRNEYKRQARKAGMPVTIDPQTLHQHAHPLLAAWGKQGRDYISLLDSYDDPNSYRAAFRDGRIDLFSEVEPLNLLNQLQDDILELRPLDETRVLWPAVDLQHDTSIRFHIAHSAQREVEILHDQLLERFSADPALRDRKSVV